MQFLTRWSRSLAGLIAALLLATSVYPESFAIKRRLPESEASIPSVRILFPNGQEVIAATQLITIRWASSDESGIVSHDVLVSKDDGRTFEPIGVGLESHAQSFQWFEWPDPEGRICYEAKFRVRATNRLGMIGQDDSDCVFTITPDHRHDRPIALGVSGGLNRSGCIGTLGSLVQDAAGIQYILSNNHVLAQNDYARIGDGIVQPGSGDVGHANQTDPIVADLSDFIPLERETDNFMDAAIAQVRPGKVSASGAILNIGPPSTETLLPERGMKVKKQGRTTGLTFGTITNIDVTVVTARPDDCPTAGGYTFKHQFTIEPCWFCVQGDSGSLIVRDETPHPRAVGLLWGRNATCTTASPIGLVLAALGVNIVGAPEDRGSTMGETGSSSMGKNIDQLIEELHLAQPEKVREAISIKQGYEQNLLQLENVVGVGVGLSDDRTSPAITIFLKDTDPETQARIPNEIEGVPTRVIVSGPFRFLHCPDDQNPITQDGASRPSRQTFTWKRHEQTH